MKNIANQSWRSLKISNKELQLKPCLSGGQSFRWKYHSQSNEWIGIIKGSVYKLKENDDGLLYKLLGSINSECYTSNDINYEACDTILKKYFRLNVNLNQLYEQWSENDEIFRSVSSKFYGIRILDQDPVENLFSFICSQNNHISRISSMIEKLCSHYGHKICEDDDVTYYSFPDVKSLTSKDVENNLRQLGFGYRAKFIQQSAIQIFERGEKEWFESLVEKTYSEAKLELIKLPGVGPKVADCICLMSLNHLEAVPVDTHVYQIAANLYLKHLKGRKTVTGAMYNEIGDHFRKLYGSLAGWAHTVLFCADLKKFEESNSKRISDSITKNVSKKKKSS